MVALASVAALCASLLVPDATHQDLLVGITGPGPGHPLGTDDLGRDVLQLLIAGARTAVCGAFLVATGSMLLGNLIGLPAGYLGGWVDIVAMRWADLMFSLPSLLVAIVVSGVLGGGYALSVAILVVLFAPGDTRVIRGAVLEQRTRPYVEASRLKNLPTWRIMTHHVWPNVAPVAVANAFLNFAYALVALASLSFLGLGVEPGSPDWGRTLSDNRTQLFTNPWAALAPGLAIILTAAAVNILGDWLYERFDARGTTR
ncbi:ABC transporter permease [Micromonospora sp. CPCC 206060]|uniref:ABC transporter permease n=1 Tax=Micromonospora sp. CPCC 206060 TaxID=3122406 RepID=UPI002FF286EA